MKNFYEILPSKYRNKSFNPNKGKKHQFDLPLRAIISGPSGSGKTNALINVLYAFTGTFDKIVLFFDNDYPGVRSANKYKKKYGCKCIFIKRKYRNDISNL